MLTGGGTFAACVLPHGLHGNSPPSSLLQQRALRQRFIRYFRRSFAFTVMHGRQIYSNIARLSVRCSVRAGGVKFVSLLRIAIASDDAQQCAHTSHYKGDRHARTLSGCSR